MNFIQAQGFDVKKGQTAALQKWLEANEEKISADCPDGISYEGTYAVVQTSEKTTGAVLSLWRMESYGAMDAFSAAMKEGGSFARLMEEFTEFLDQERDANWSSFLARRMTDTAIWGE
jgi:hypothetical protein